MQSLPLALVYCLSDPLPQPHQARLANTLGLAGYSKTQYLAIDPGMHGHTCMHVQGSEVPETCAIGEISAFVPLASVALLENLVELTPSRCGP